MQKIQELPAQNSYKLLIKLIQAKFCDIIYKRNSTIHTTLSVVGFTNISGSVEFPVEVPYSHTIPISVIISISSSSYQKEYVLYVLDFYLKRTKQILEEQKNPLVTLNIWDDESRQNSLRVIGESTYLTSGIEFDQIRKILEEQRLFHATELKGIVRVKILSIQDIGL